MKILILINLILASILVGLLSSCAPLRQEIEDPLVLRWADKILNEKETGE